MKILICLFDIDLNDYNSWAVLYDLKKADGTIIDKFMPFLLLSELMN
jgi:hypothetical protein